jgi:hypothetical protein
MTNHKVRQNLEQNFIRSLGDIENIFRVHRVQSSLQRNHILGAVNSTLCIALNGAARTQLASDSQNETIVRRNSGVSSLLTDDVKDAMDWTAIS